MAVPATRAEFKEYVLRALGKGAIRINVTDDQVEDRIDEALKLAQDYHFAFTEQTYYKHQVTANTISNGYIDLPDNVIGAVDIFNLSDTMMGGGIFNAQYQFVFQNIWEWQAQSMIPYFIGFQQMQFIEQILVGKQPIRYNRIINRLNIDMSWERIKEGQYLIVHTHATVDPTVYPKIWSDRWFQRYTTAKVKYLWGENMAKFGNVPGIGGTTLNGQTMKEEAQIEIDKLEEELQTHYKLPADFLVG